MNNLVCVIASEPIFNPSKVKPFEELSIKDTVFFYSLLLANYIELLDNSTIKYEKVFLVNKSDQQFIPKSFFPAIPNHHLIDFNKMNTVFDSLNKNIFLNYNKLILIRSNSIGIKKNDIARIFGLLSSEENCAVIGKSITNEIVFSAHNKIANFEFESFFNNENSFDKHLSEISRSDTFISVFENLLSLSTFADFRKLYSELSTKDSLNYCSEQMHERFTNLFIEYKEQLK